ncbi:MAG: hypothetical protein M3277_05565 [Actinomycetota bacterium]|nr:hypothetical protein [Actinomycetota bacterium]
MTSAQLILISVTSALVAVTAMLIVATIRRARARDDAASEGERDRTEESDPGVGPS